MRVYGRSCSVRGIVRRRVEGGGGARLGVKLRSDECRGGEWEGDGFVGAGQKNLHLSILRFYHERVQYKRLGAVRHVKRSGILIRVHSISTNIANIMKYVKHKNE